MTDTTPAPPPLTPVGKPTAPVKNLANLQAYQGGGSNVVPAKQNAINLANGGIGKESNPATTTAKANAQNLATYQKPANYWESNSKFQPTPPGLYGPIQNPIIIQEGTSNNQSILDAATKKNTNFMFNDPGYYTRQQALSLAEAQRQANTKQANFEDVKGNLYNIQYTKEGFSVAPPPVLVPPKIGFKTPEVVTEIGTLSTEAGNWLTNVGKQNENTIQSWNLNGTGIRNKEPFYVVLSYPSYGIGGGLKFIGANSNEVVTAIATGALFEEAEIGTVFMDFARPLKSIAPLARESLDVAGKTLGLAFLAERTGEVASAPTREAKGAVIGKTAVDIGAFSFGQEMSRSTLREVTFTSVGFPYLQYLETKGLKYIPRQEVTTEDTVMNPEAKGLLFAKGNTPFERLTDMRTVINTPYRSAPPGEWMRESGKVSVSSSTYATIPYDISTTQEDFFPYNEKPIMMPLLASEKTGGYHGEYSIFYHAAEGRLPQTGDVVLGAGTSESQGLAISYGNAERFTRLRLDTPRSYSYSLSSSAQSPEVLQGFRFKQETIGRLPNAVSQDYAKADLYMLFGQNPVYEAPKVYKGGAEAEWTIPSGTVTPKLLAKAGETTPETPVITFYGWKFPNSLYENKPLFTKESIITPKAYRTDFGKKYGFDKYTVIDYLPVAIREVKYKGYTTKLYTYVPGVQGAIVTEEFHSARSINKEYKGVSVDTEETPILEKTEMMPPTEKVIDESILKNFSSSPFSSSRNIGYSSHSLITSQRSSRSSPRYSRGYSSGYSMGSSGSQITSSGSSPSYSSGSSYSSPSSRSSSSSVSSSQSSSSSRSYSEQITPYSTAMTLFQIPKGTFSFKRKREKDRLQEFIYPLSSPQEMALSLTLFGKNTSPGREKLKEFKISRERGTDTFPTYEERSRRGRQAMKHLFRGIL